MDCCVVADGGNAIMAFVTPTSRIALFAMLTPWQSATQSIAVSHMLLNVREAAENSSDSRPSELPTIETFHARPVSPVIISSGVHE